MSRHNSKRYGDQLSKIFDAFSGKGGSIKSGILQTLQFAEDQIFEYLQEERDVRNDINKSMSVTGKLGDDIRDTILQSSIYANRYGLQLKDVVDEFKGLNSETGRFATLTTQISRRSIFTAAEVGLTLGEMGKAFGQFERVGYGLVSAQDAIDTIAKRALTLGISGADSSTFINVNLFKNRLYFTQKDTMKCWYLDVEAIGGEEIGRAHV